MPVMRGKYRETNETYKQGRLCCAARVTSESFPPAELFRVNRHVPANADLFSCPGNLAPPRNMISPSQIPY